MSLDIFAGRSDGPVDDFVRCVHCRKFRSLHAEDKCLFDATSFTPETCPCGHTYLEHSGWDFGGKCFVCDCDSYQENIP